MVTTTPTTTPTTPTTATTSAASTANAADDAARTTLAGNFDTFLQLLTTQLQNQDPLSPLDTNQFTEQLVQFASVEQQINMNTSLSTLISLQQASQTSAAMSFLGASVIVDGSTAQLQNGSATWNFSVDRPSTGTVNVSDSSGNVVFTQTGTLGAGAQAFTWNGSASNGAIEPAGAYTISIVAKDASGQQAAVSTQVEGVVDGVDFSQSPPLLSIGGQSFTLDKIKQVTRPAATATN
jgi:flagellar basal-body rod modification protein FlgD